MQIHGYDPNGPDTHGAAYARAHPDDLPDECKPGTRLRYGHRSVRTGSVDTVVSVPVRFVAGIDHRALVLDTRKADAETLTAKLPVGRLLLWRGMYWRVHAVHGVFVQLDMWGTKRRRHGWRLTQRAGVEFAERVQP